MKTLILIRHTETEYLAQTPTSQLSNDARLSVVGRSHAHTLSERLASYPVELVISSLYHRSQETAEILNARWKAKAISAMALNEYFLRQDGTGVESVEHAFVRCSQFLNPYRLTFDTIAMVSHNSLLSTFMTGLLNLSFDEGKALFAKLGQVYILGYDCERGEQKWCIRDEIQGV